MLEAGSTLHADRRSPARPVVEGNPAAGEVKCRTAMNGPARNPSRREPDGNASAPAGICAVENATGLAQSRVHGQRCS